jgi:hypothetical protein
MQNGHILRKEKSKPAPFILTYGAGSVLSVDLSKRNHVAYTQKEKTDTEILLNKLNNNNILK